MRRLLGHTGAPRDVGQTVFIGIAKTPPGMAEPGVSVATVGDGPRFWHAHLEEGRVFWYASLAEGEIREHGGAVLGDGEFLRVEVATRPLVERSQLVARGDLLAALLERLDAQRATSDDEIAAVVAASVASLDSATKSILTSAARSDPLLYRRLLDDIEQLFIEQLVERS